MPLFERCHPPEMMCGDASYIVMDMASEGHFWKTENCTEISEANMSTFQELDEFSRGIRVEGCLIREASRHFSGSL